MAQRSGGDGLIGWLVGGLVVGAIVLGLLVAAYAVGYRHGKNTANSTSSTTPAATTPATVSTTPAPTTTVDLLAEGKGVFASAGCSGCHTLADAGATGGVGPNLDEKKPPEQIVVDRVTHGKGAMPPFAGQLSEEQIRAVAAYVAQAAG